MASLDKPIFDTIETTGKTYQGIIDYANKKHVLFYDTTNNTDPTIVLIVISWRMTYEDMRFSVFKDIFFPSVPLDAILIPKKAIKNSPPVEDQTPKQNRKRITKSLRSSLYS